LVERKDKGRAYEEEINQGRGGSPPIFLGELWGKEVTICLC